MVLEACLLRPALIRERARSVIVTFGDFFDVFGRMTFSKPRAHQLAESQTFQKLYQSLSWDPNFPETSLEQNMFVVFSRLEVATFPMLITWFIMME